MANTGVCICHLVSSIKRDLHVVCVAFPLLSVKEIASASIGD